MNPAALNSNTMKIGSVMMLVMAAQHFYWTWAFIQEGQFHEYPGEVRDWISLTTSVIGLLLLFVGGCSWWMAGRAKRGERAGAWFGLAIGILIIGRMLLEIMFPVRLSLMGIENPTQFIIPLTSVIILLYLLPAWLQLRAGPEK